MRRFVVAAGAAGVLAAVIPVAHADSPGSTPDISSTTCSSVSTSGSVGSHSVGPICPPNPLSFMLCTPVWAQIANSTVSGTACVPFPIAEASAGRV